MDETRIVRKLSRVSILGNVVLAACKLAAGLLGRSGAMVSDAVYSLSDVFTTVVAYIGVRLAQQQEDERHIVGVGHGADHAA